MMMCTLTVPCISEEWTQESLGITWYTIFIMLPQEIHCMMKFAIHSPLSDAILCSRARRSCIVILGDGCVDSVELGRSNTWEHQEC